MTVLEAVEELPQPSEATKVLICEAEHEPVTTGPSVKVTEGVLQAAVAVAFPSAAVISEAVGLQPRVTLVLVIIIVGGLGAFVQVTVLEVVLELPHASMAVNVLVWEAEHVVVDTLPSVNVTVAVLHPSEAVALPRAALMSEAVGLQPSVVGPPLVVITGAL